jgi:WD40 repeat protein
MADARSQRSIDRTLRVGELRNRQHAKGHTREVIAVVVTTDGRRVLSASDDQTLRVWDLESGQTSHCAFHACPLL